MPRKEFEAFTRLDASDVNTFLMDQSVMTFGSATARDAAIDTPVEGQVTYLTDIDSLTVYNGTQWVTNRPVMSFAGTAARGSAISSPVEGMTTYLEDLDVLEVYSGSVFQAPYGLIPVATIPFTTASSVNVDNVFSSKYTNYKIVINIDTASAGGQLTVFFRDSTPADIGTTNSVTFFAFDTGTAITSVASGGNQLGRPLGSGATGGMNYFDLNLNNPASTSRRILWGTYVGQTTDSGGRDVIALVRNSQNSATPAAGIRLAIASGTITGSIRVYGLRN